MAEPSEEELLARIAELERQASIRPDPAFPHILISSVDPALLIPVRRKRRWSPWILLAVLVIAVGAFIIARPKAIGTAGLKIWAALQSHSEILLPVGLIVIATGSVLLLWLLPQWQTARLHALTPEAEFEKENESRKTLAQIIGGLFVIGSLFSTANSTTYQRRSSCGIVVVKCLKKDRGKRPRITISGAYDVRMIG